MIAFDARSNFSLTDNRSIFSSPSFLSPLRSPPPYHQPPRPKYFCLSLFSRAVFSPLSLWCPWRLFWKKAMCGLEFKILQICLGQENQVLLRSFCAHTAWMWFKNTSTLKLNYTYIIERHVKKQTTHIFLSSLLCSWLLFFSNL